MSFRISDIDSYLDLVARWAPAEPLPCPIAYHARRRADQVAIQGPEGDLSYRQLDRAVRAYVVGLKDSGAGRGARLAVQPIDQVHAILILFAGMRIGASTLLLSTRLPEEALTDALRATGAETRLNVAPTAVTGNDTDEVTNDAQSELIDPSIRATVLFTSGSSGAPRAAVHSAANHFSSALGSSSALALAPGDAWLMALPLYHVGGLAIVFRCFTAGATLVLRDEKASLGESLRRERVSHVSLVATQLGRLLAEKEPAPATLREVLVGGGIVPSGLIKRAIRSGYPIRTTYGSTETASQVATSQLWTDEREAYPAGRSLPNFKIRIASDREIVVKGDPLFMGYLSPEGLDRAIDDEGWYRTGDLGVLDSGELTVIGRKDAMFISGGENIQPEEIEREILNCEGVSSAIVVPVPDVEFGQRPVAFVDMREDDFDSIRLVLERRLPHFKIPDAFFPLTGDELEASTKARRSEFQLRAAELAAMH
ncbi:MAG: o-succinylbenzoate--CoA ligase [Bacteroidetes bacterium]|nr:o-succinylbenzoate--CoA ligase [Bacteroidota bacterium]